MGNFNRDNSYSRGSSDRDTFKATCADCGKSCDLPFRPTTGRAVYCRDCFKKHSPGDRRGQDMGRGRDRFSQRTNSRGADREMFDATCANCGNKCKVPFMPREGKDTLCSNCFEEKGGDPRRSTNGSAQQLNDINAKLDKILELLSPVLKNTPTKPKPVKTAIEEVQPTIAEEIVPATEAKEVKTVKKPKAKTKSKSK